MLRSCGGSAYQTFTQVRKSLVRLEERGSPKKALAKSQTVTIVVTVVANNLQFSIAVHIMAGLACLGGRQTTSATLAGSVNTSPSFVRRTLAKLSKAGLVKTATGKAGACWLGRR